MTIRLAQQEDALAISQLVKSLSHYYCDINENELPIWFQKTISEQATRDRLLSANFQNHVYQNNDVIAGYIAIKDRSHICHLFVREDFQGKGIAKQLWQYASKASGSKAFTVRSSLYAVPIYERFGFRVTGSVESKDGISFQPMQCQLTQDPH